MDNNTIFKGVIPAAGLGTRFLPATKAQPKEMLPVGDKPAIQHVIEEAVSGGLKNLLIVTGRGKRTIEDHFDRSFELEYYLEQSGRFAEADKIKDIANMALLYYVRQGQPKGLGDAIRCAKNFVGSSPFVVFLADDLFTKESYAINKMIELFKVKRCAILLVKELPLDQVSSYGVIDFEPTGDNDLLKVKGVVEKPSPGEAPSSYCVLGRYVFSHSIFKHLERLKPDKRGEIQLTDAISQLAKEEEVYALVFKGKRYDIGNKADYVRANIEYFLKDPEIYPKLSQLIKEIARDLIA